MSKRSLSPPPLPPSKRFHSLSGSTAVVTSNFDSALYEELILLIFSNLSWVDLCAAQAVNRNWARLALDNGLWKDQYLHVFGRSRLRGAKGFIGRTDGREIKRLPERAKVDDIKDWRWMFRISWNWKKAGRCSTEHIEGVLDPPSSGSTPTSTPAHVVLAGSMTIVASSEASLCPEVHCHVQSAASPKQTLLCGSPRHRQPFHITALALDQSPPLSGVLQLAVFLSTGEFLIFAIQQLNPTTSTRKFTYVPSRSTTRTTPIIQAVYHHPLLISLSAAFTLSLYDLSSDTITHTQTLTAYTTFPPSSLVLSAQTPGNRYKLVLTYAVPIFPVHFSIGVTELIISGSRVSSPQLSSSSSLSSPMSVISTRTARALDVPAGWIDQEKLRSMKEQWGRKLLRIQDTQSDGKWVVLAPGEVPPPGSQGPAGATSAASPYQMSGDSPASLQLYRLYLPSVTSVVSPPPKLTFVRYLHHTAGAVSSMALADGRCVTLGKNGGIWVWDLESGTGAEVAPPCRSGDPTLDSVEKGAVAFDDRRIISARAGTLLVRRFDVY
ncbi:hypothetical protein B0H17DRAFT_922726 [Mycena rosella]|uniref:F-box domain-containing protein n=1 Tax=Mycena rosella TaxID=1033263 RepID=A0AAD7DZ19_MYCRO|nr:hypothetical protein B0H17DRAFT_922726 [Mycena rosella]